MKKMLALMACMISLIGTGIAQPTLNCDDCDGNAAPLSKQPGQIAALDGTATPTGDYGDDDIVVTYEWNLYTVDETCEITGTYDWSLIDPAANEAIIDFYAPSEPGSYMAVLTVTYTLTVGGLTLTTACVDMACYNILVTEYECIECDDIFCDVDCASFPTVPVPESCEWGTNGFCYPLTTSNDIQIDWYVINDDTMITGTNEEIEVLIPTLDIADSAEDSDCYMPVWCDTNKFGSDIYQVIMVVWGSDGDGASIVTHWCPVGTVTMVEEPVAKISPVNPPI